VLDCEEEQAEQYAQRNLLVGCMTNENTPEVNFGLAQAAHLEEDLCLARPGARDSSSCIGNADERAPVSEEDLQKIQQLEQETHAQHDPSLVLEREVGKVEWQAQPTLLVGDVTKEHSPVYIDLAQVEHSADDLCSAHVGAKDNQCHPPWRSPLCGGEGDEQARTGACAGSAGAVLWHYNEHVSEETRGLAHPEPLGSGAEGEMTPVKLVPSGPDKAGTTVRNGSQNEGTVAAPVRLDAAKNGKMQKAAPKADELRTFVSRPT
jgi:hypothetical protein